MLVRFTVRNFRSFLHEQSLSYATSCDTSHEVTHCISTGACGITRLLRVGVVFGPNASGKTNLLTALETMRRIVLQSSSFTGGQFARCHTPFRLNAATNDPAHFGIEIIRDGIRYRYDFAHDSYRVRWERLLVYRTGKAQRWFERHYDLAKQTEVWAPFSPNFHGPREVWRKATRATTLFLTTAAQLRSEQVAPLFDWFARKVHILLEQNRLDGATVNRVLQRPESKVRLLRLLSAVGMTPKDIRVVEPDRNRTGNSSSGKMNRRPPPLPQLEFAHSQTAGPPTWIPSDLEGNGLQLFLGVATAVLDALEQGSLLVIDDFDASLHPLIGRYLITLAHTPAAGRSDTQFLLVSHNNLLMDLDRMRRDQIWLMDRDKDQASVLSNLRDAAPRRREHIAKAYLKGRYGAVPNINSETTDTAVVQAGITIG